MYLASKPPEQKRTILFTFSDHEKIQKISFLFLYIKKPTYPQPTNPYHTNVSTTYPQPDFPFIHRPPPTYPQCYPQPTTTQKVIHRLIHSQANPKTYPQLYPQTTKSYPQANFYNLKCI